MLPKPLQEQPSVPLSLLEKCSVPVEDMVDRSFYEVFKNGDRKWLVAYADVAGTGVLRLRADGVKTLGIAVSTPFFI